MTSLIRPITFSVFLFFVLAPCAWAQDDYHLTQDANRFFYYYSAFAHGHRHGYEEGYHAGDEDYHFRKPAEPRQRMSKQRGYRPEFGNKASYARGYERGFIAGNADSYSGRAFRATQTLVLEAPVDFAARSQTDWITEFDAGVAAGYRGGLSNAAGVVNAGAGSASWLCRQEQHSASYCDGYGPGYMLGRGDSESAALMIKAGPTSLAKNTH